MPELLQQGLEAFKAGQREQARKLLIAALKQNPDELQAWETMLDLSSSQAERDQCTRQIARLQPPVTVAKAPPTLPNHDVLEKTFHAELEEIKDEIYIIREAVTDKKASGYLTVFLNSLVFGNLVAAFWALDYLNSTVIGDEEILLWKYVSGAEYGLGLGAESLLFVIISRYLLGFAFATGICYAIGCLIVLIRSAFK
jgi:hypothetical protein